MNWLFASLILLVSAMFAQAEVPSGGAVVVPNVAALASTPGSPDKLVWVKGYKTENDGGGGPFFFSTGSWKTNRGTVFACASGGFWVRPHSGEINVKWFGARGDGSTDDTLAIREAIAASNDPSSGGDVFFPPGRFNISGTLSNKGSRLALRGSGHVFMIFNSYTNGTAIVFTSDDAPIVALSGEFDSISDINLMYKRFQPTNAVNSSCILLTDQTVAASLKNITLMNGYRGIYAPGFAYACVLDNICIEKASGQYMHWAAGEQNSATSLYFQNFHDPQIPVDVSRISRKGSRITIPIPRGKEAELFAVNTLVAPRGWAGAPQYDSPEAFVTEVTPNSLSFDLPSDPKVDPVSKSPGKPISFFHQSGHMVGPAVYIGAEFAIQALTCEIVTLTDRGAMIEIGGNATVNIQSVHFEYCFWKDRVREVNPIINYGPALHISSIVMVSSGLPPGRTVAVVTQARPGFTDIGAAKFGGVAHKGANFVLAASCPDGFVSFGPVQGLGTAKANSDGSVDSPGSALRHLYQSDQGIVRLGQIGESTHAGRTGTATLKGDSTEIPEPRVTAKSRIFITGNADGGTPGTYRVISRKPGVSFTVASSLGAADTSTIAYQLVEP